VSFVVTVLTQAELFGENSLVEFFSLLGDELGSNQIFIKEVVEESFTQDTAREVRV
jgi:hypothetical protein